MDRILIMTNELFKNILPTLIGTYVIATAGWVYTSNDRMTVTEQQMLTVQATLAENTETMTNVQYQLNQYNNELIKLVSKQDQRLVKMETILSMMVDGQNKAE